MVDSDKQKAPSTELVEGDDDNFYDDDEVPFMWLEGDSLAPPCGTIKDVVRSLIKLANLQQSDTLYDLGSGDGRVCIAAAKAHGIKAVGIEIEEYLIKKFNSKIKQYNLEDKVKAVHGDITLMDYSDATVITIYLLPKAIELIRGKLIAMLEKGCRIVCNFWGIDGLRAVKEETCGPYNNVNLYLYTKDSLL